jgi:hypothetical protein
MYRCTVLKDHLQVNPSIKFAENEEENNNQFYHDQTDHLIEEEWENPSFLVKDLDTGQSYIMLNSIIIPVTSIKT